MRAKILMFSVFMHFSIAIDLPPGHLWEKSFEDYSCYSGTSIEQTLSGGYITVSEGDLIKLDYNGDQLWKVSIGDTSFNPMLYSLVELNDGDLILAGKRDTLGMLGNDAVWIIRTNGDGTKKWERTYDLGFEEAAHTIEPTEDGGFILVGQARKREEEEHDGFMLKTDLLGNLEWVKYFGGGKGDSRNSVRQTSDGGYITTGSRYDSNQSLPQGWLIRTDVNGDTLWTKSYGNEDIYNLRSIENVKSGGFIISANRFNSPVLFRIDDDGNTIWLHRYDLREESEQSNYTYSSYSVIQTSDGGFMLVGSMNTGAHGPNKPFVLKTDSTGNMQWNDRKFDWIGNMLSVKETNDGGFIVSGGFWEHLGVIKYPPPNTWIKDVGVYPSELSPGQPVIITALMNGQDEFLITAEIETLDSLIVGTINLYDDGNHYDGEAGDRLYGNKWNSHSDENHYVLNFEVNNYERIDYSIENVKQITSAGPIVVDSIIYNSPESSTENLNVTLSLRLKNLGITKPARDLRASISLSDPCIFYNDNYPRRYDDLEPGGTATRDFLILLTDSCFEKDELLINLRIWSEGYIFWRDSFYVDLKVVGTEDERFAPDKYTLNQNYPNPFNPTTTISFALPKAGKTSLIIYDLLGKEVARLVDGKMDAGYHSVSWDASNVASGIYFYRLTAGGFVETKKMVLMK